MTNLEAILSNIPVEVDENAMIKVCLDRGLEGEGTYRTVNAKIVNLATADALVLASRSVDFSESKLSIKIPRGKLLNDAIRLYNENGEASQAESLSPFKAYDISKRW